MNSKVLPSGLTSYDLLKTFAVLTMVVDHFGLYFFPDEMWWRVVGRVSAPVWLFLIGYACSRDISPRLFSGASILVLASAAFNSGILPINILLNVIFIRYVLDGVLARMRKSFSNALEIWVLIVLLALPTSFISDYGIIGLAVAIFGAMVRENEGKAAAMPSSMVTSGLAACVLYCALIFLTFDFTFVQNGVAMVFVGLVFVGLAFFRPAEWALPSVSLPHIMVRFFQFCGRYSLEIYVVHLLIFKMASFFLGL
jgi:hypothetical protein